MHLDVTIQLLGKPLQGIDPQVGQEQSLAAAGEATRNGATDA